MILITLLLGTAIALNSDDEPKVYAGAMYFPPAKPIYERPTHTLDEQSKIFPRSNYFLPTRPVVGKPASTLGKWYPYNDERKAYFYPNDLFEQMLSSIRVKREAAGALRIQMNNGLPIHDDVKPVGSREPVDVSELAETVLTETKKFGLRQRCGQSKMDIKILIAVFFLIWKITISQQVSEPKDLRMKRYQESHIDEIKKQSSLTNHQNGKNKKYIELGPPALEPVNFMNKNINPEKRTQSKVFRIKPSVPNKRKPFKFVVKNQDKLNFTNDGLNEINVTYNKPREEKITIDLKDFSDVSTDESSPKKGTDTLLGDKFINKLNKKNPYNNTSASKPAFFIDLPTSQNLLTTQSKTAKLLVTEQKPEEKPNTEMKQSNVQIDTMDATDEAIYNETEDTNSRQAKFNPIENDDAKGKLMKHPFLDAIQNDRYLMCSPQGAPNASVIADTTSIEDIELRFRDDRLSKSLQATPDQAVEMIFPHIDTKDELQDVTIKSCAFEEISEISNIPQVTLDPEFNSNNIPVPYEYNQVLKTIDLHNQLDSRTPDEQIEKKDENNVYIYNNFYQRPNECLYGNNYQKPYKQSYQDGYCSYYQPTTAYNANYGNSAPRAIPGIQNYWNKVDDTKRDDNRMRNAYYGYNSAQPQQMQNYWFRDYDTSRGINERIHRKWMNTEYNVKGKNAFKQVSDDNLKNRHVQSGPMRNAGGFI